MAVGRAVGGGCSQAVVLGWAASDPDCSLGVGRARCRGGGGSIAVGVLQPEPDAGGRDLAVGR